MKLSLMPIVTSSVHYVSAQGKGGVPRLVEAGEAGGLVVKRTGKWWKVTRVKINLEYRGMRMYM
eukprot:740937-Amorphochlora_amoeboformis.AAC.1